MVHSPQQVKIQSIEMRFKISTCLCQCKTITLQKAEKRNKILIDIRTNKLANHKGLKLLTVSHTNITNKLPFSLLFFFF